MNKTTNVFPKEYDPTVNFGPVPSPCINVCEMNPHTGLCEGCFRTIDEIASWSGASESAKKALWIEIRRRQSIIENGAVL